MLSNRHPDETTHPPLEQPSAEHEQGMELLRQAEVLLNSNDIKAVECIKESLVIWNKIGDKNLISRSEAMIGRVLVHLGDAEKAVAHLVKALEIAESQASESEIRCDLGKAYLNLGRFKDAERQLNIALSLVDKNSTTGAEIHNLMAGMAHATGQYDDALEHLQISREIFKNNREYNKEIYVLTNLGSLFSSYGRYSRAIEYLMEAHSLALQLERSGKSETRIRSNISISIGAALLDMGDVSGAEKYFREALYLAREASNATLETNAVLNLASALQAAGKLGEAQERYLEALRLSKAGQYRHFETAALDGLGQIMMSRSEWGAARDFFRQAGELARETGDLEDQLDALLHLGEVEKKRQAFPEAREALEAALKLAQEVGRPKSVCDLHRALYRLHAGSGDSAAALHHLEQLYQLEREIQNTEVEQRVKEMTGKIEVERAQHQAELSHYRMVAAEEAREVAEARVRERTRSLEQTQLEVVTRLALAAEYRDDTTGQHTWRVGQISATIAQELGWPAEEVELMRIASRLHDVGKIGVSDRILLKPGKLTAEEFAQMQLHTVIGQRILSGGETRLLRLAEEIALNHHERWAGGGYPNNLRGEDIPLSARIVSVADVFDALTHVRSYKAAWTVADALAELQNLSGTSFDPRVVEAALKVLPLSNENGVNDSDPSRHAGDGLW